ncbi:MAG TPA: helix-turn-helix transcriptional regulator [Steroidobacter sp.]|uniref:helix-turn-helix transcriptional regulator n=1 Tax=Steroidobacter sp. TaxID=1978227 RepID=UPI002ED7B167
MPTVTDSRSEDALALSHAILHCHSFENLTSSLLAPLTRLLNAETSVVFEVFEEGSTLRLGRSARHEIAQKTLVDYENHFIRLDPVYSEGITSLRPAAAPAPRLDIVQLANLVDMSRFSQTHYYNEFLRPIGIHDVVALVLRPDEAAGHSFVFGFHRPQSASGFSDQEVARAMQVAPTLFACLKTFLLADRMKEREEVIDGLLRATADMGVIILDAARELRYVSSRAAEFLGADLSSPRTGAVAELSRVHSWILNMCARIDNSRGISVVSERVAALAGRESYGDAVLTVQRFETQDGERRYLATICPSAVENALRVRSAALGMTRRELDIVRLVAAGSTNAQIADRLCLARRTVENHLRSIFAKANVHSRTQLIHELLAERGR